MGEFIRNCNYSYKKQKSGGKGNLKLTDEHIHKLKHIGLPAFKDAPDCQELLDEYDASKIGLLIEFKDEYGHTNVPSGHDLEPWIKEVRQKKVQGKMRPEICTILDNIGFQWVPFTFMEGIAAFIDQKGKSIETNTPLYYWCQDVRQKDQANKLSKNELLLLRSAKFDRNYDSVKGKNTTSCIMFYA